MFWVKEAISLLCIKSLKTYREKEIWEGKGQSESTQGKSLGI